MKSGYVILLLYLCSYQALHAQIVRGDSSQKRIALVFTGDEFGDGGTFIQSALADAKVKASFFLTGNFYRKSQFKRLIRRLKTDGHYLGSHSDKHLLYCDWRKRDSLLVTKREFTDDLSNSYAELEKYGVAKTEAFYFLPPYEWYNDSIAGWTMEMGLQLVNFTPGTRSTADYTYPEMGNRYVASSDIYASILKYERENKAGLNGFILLVHIGTDPRRKDKFYYLLPRLINDLRNRGYEWVRIDELLSNYNLQ